MSALAKYHAARHALAVCKNVDEVKDILDKAEAMRAYGVIANDTTLEHDAIEIRLRAERRLGEMISQQKAADGLSKGGRPAEKPLDPPEGLSAKETARPPRGVSESPTLASAGISHDLSARAQNIAAVPEKEFEKEIAGFRDRTKKDGKQVQTRLNERGKEVRGKPAKPPKVKPSDAAKVAELEAEVERLQAWGNANAQTAKELLAENDAMSAILEADDKLAALAKENKTLRAQVRVLNERNNGMMNETAAAKKSAQMWQRRTERAEKATVGAN